MWSEFFYADGFESCIGMSYVNPQKQGSSVSVQFAAMNIHKRLSTHQSIMYAVNLLHDHAVTPP